MEVYQTNLDGVFVHTTIADQDPLDSNNFLIPLGCVQTAPPPFGDGERARWDVSSWVVEPIPIEEEEEVDSGLSAADEARFKRQGLLENTDWTQVSDAPVDKAAWASYRTLLRDVPQQSGFPHDITWPTKPE